MESKKHKTISQGSLISMVAALFILLGIMACAISPVFVLKDVEIKGNTYISNEDIMRIGSITKGENLFHPKTDDAKRTLVKDLRIEQATVQRVFPSKLEIDIVERVPLAMIACDYGYLELGQDGIVLDAHRSLRDMPVPMINGATVSNLFVGDSAGDENVLQVLAFLARLDGDTLKKISEINITDTSNVLLYAAGSVQIKIGPLQELGSKVDITESVVKELNQAKHPIEYVDARFEAYSVKLRQ